MKIKSLTDSGIEVPQLNVPLNQKVLKSNYKFLKPSNISIVGSYPLGTSVGPNIIVDVMVEMPSKLFHKHDYQDYRYLRKRATYLSYIAAHLTEDLVEKKTFIGESWMLQLKLIPTGSLSKRITVYVHLAAAVNSFKLNRFLPEKNCVRSSWYFNETTTTNKLIPTPQYNTNILRDLTMAEVNSKNAKIIQEYPNIRDGIILLKIWLQQRQPEKAYDGFNGHIMTMYVLYLLHEKILNTFMSSYQIVRNVWHNLAQSNWCQEGITMCYEAESKARVAQYHQYYDCVFIDTTGYHNLVANITANNYNWIRNQADMAVKCLDNSSIDSFHVLFMKRLTFFWLFDQFICLHDTDALQQLAEEHATEDIKLDLGVNTRAQVIKILMKVLKKGLGQRVAQIYIQPAQYDEWQVTEQKPTGIKRIIIGFQLNPDYCFNLIEKGPPANLPEAIEFRKFWEEKSELRRFQDGSISEAVVWGKIKTLAEKRIITKKIIMYLLKGKFNISKEQYFYGADQIDEFLKLKKTMIKSFSYGTGEEATLRVLEVFNDLEQQLRALTDLPLSITGVQGSSPVFRYTDVFPPLATTNDANNKNTKLTKHCLLLKADSLVNAPKYITAIEASIQLSSSGKWPDELEAVRKTKAAFHIQIARCLRKQCKLTTKASPNHVDILKKGFVFRLIVAHPKEITLLKQQTGDDGVIKYRDNEESIKLENALFHLPKLSGALHGLHSQQPSFGPTCCLIKRWLSSQLIDNYHMPDIVVELLLASMYLTPDPYKPAQTPQVGFLRFLEFFARDLWITDAIIVNFNNEMTRELIVEVENNFTEKRETLPPLFISTPYDPKTSMWTIKAPTRVILTRVGNLAKEVLKLVETELFESTTLSWMPLFKPPMTAYDCLIHLKDKFCPRRYQFYDLDDSILNKVWPALKKDEDNIIPIVEFDPVIKYLEDLRKSYGEFALFFHDTYGGNVIGVLLIPNSLGAKEFKVANMNCRRLNDNGKLILNTSVMLEDFSNLGQGLVNKIIVQSDKIQ